MKLKLLLFTILSIASFREISFGQSAMINLSAIDGVPINIDNVFNYQINCSASGNYTIRGVIKYRQTNLSISYSFDYRLSQGMNQLSTSFVHPKWQFSSSALKELFLVHKILPEGTFEYCVTVAPVGFLPESGKNASEECLYRRSDDIFLINLVDPVDKSKLDDFNPLLSWVANYSVSNELTYRIKVAEIKHEQTPVNAVMRNQPVYTESNLMQNSIVYPVYARQLVVNQPYAWTVDAYYKGILLGGSETWQFIITDSLPQQARISRSYIDIKRENGAKRLLVQGTLKLKYLLDDAANDLLTIKILDDNNNKVGKLTSDKLTAKYGDNRYVIDLNDQSNLKHNQNYTLEITTKTQHTYRIPIQYINPNFLK